MSDSIGLAKAATERERDRKKQTASDLEKDRDAWAEDQQFAQAALEKLQSRTSRLQKTILDTRTRISELRTELADLNGRLMAEGKQREQAIKKSSATSGTTARR
jgi:predicted  nucleic acid-binding Zn-ribbon protein